MRFFFDTEFIEDGKTIDLISIGIVTEDGRQYYAEVEDAPWERASDWVKDNVIVHLHGPLKSRPTIRDEVLAFIGQDNPEIWAYYADYDWVALCQLFGTMMDLPKGWPMYCRDLKQLIGNFQIIKFGIEHDALSDAQSVKRTFEAFHAQELG